MRKIKVYIAASLDGYIARPDGDLDWLTKYPITPEINYGYNKFFDSVDTVIMGGNAIKHEKALSEYGVKRLVLPLLP